MKHTGSTNHGSPEILNSRAAWTIAEDRYERHLVTRRYAAATVRRYVSWTTRLQRYFLEEGRDDAPADVTTAGLRDFMARHDWRSLNTTNDAIKAITYFFEWAAERGLVAASPAAGLPRRRLVEHPIPAQWVWAWSQYVQHLQAGGCRPQTVKLRQHHLRRLAEHLGPLAPFEVHQSDLEEWLALQEWAPETRKSAQTTLRGFYAWAEVSGHVPDSPARRLRPVRVPPGRPRPVPEREVATALATTTGRERLMVMLAAYAGLRAGEIASLHTQNVEIDEEWDTGSDGVQQQRLVGQLRVLGKGGRTRTVPLQPDGDLVHALREHIGVRRNAVFPGQTDGHLSSQYVSRLVSKVLGPGWSAHPLRHRFASAGYAGTRDLRAMQTLLGHSKPETTARYTAVADGTLLDAVVAAGRRPH